MDIIENDTGGYSPLISFNGWRVAIVNYCERGWAVSDQHKVTKSKESLILSPKMREAQSPYSSLGAINSFSLITTPLLYIP